MGGIVDAVFGGGDDGSAQAAQASANASLEATKLSLEQQDKMYQDTKAMQKPYSDLALSAITQAYGGKDAQGNYYFDPNKLNQYTQDNPFKYQDFNGSQYQMQQFDPSKIDLNADPSYQYRLQQGVNALDKSASAKGMLLSGAQQKAVQDYGQQMGTQQYQQAYQNALTANQQQNANTAQNYSQALGAYQQNQGNALTSYNSDVALGNQRYNQLASVLGQGQVANNALTQANANYANTYTGAQMQNANNIASANAFAVNANNQSQANSTNALLGVGSLGLAGAKLFSDARLKKNIELLGTLPNGVNIYEYEYVWDSMKHIGVMAQEVMHIPNAVSVHESGYYMVDYSKIGVL